MCSKISSWILKVLGWRITGNYPEDVKKFVVAVVPHTSNWDFPLGLLVRSSLKKKIKFIGKSSLFVFPIGLLFRALGGTPVDRSKRSNFVEGAIKVFNDADELAVTIAPEGTRKKVDKLKTGFYFIALGAKVPILLTKFDYDHKEVDFGELFYPTGDVENDMNYISHYFHGTLGKNKEHSFYVQ